MNTSTHNEGGYDSERCLETYFTILIENLTFENMYSRLFAV